MTADPLVYDRKNKRKVLTHIDGRKQYFTLNNREIEDSEHPYSDELRKSMWKAYQLGREYNHSHDQVVDYLRSYPSMNKSILDEIAQRGTEAIPDIESGTDLPLHEPYQFKSDSDIRDIRRSEDEDVMSEAYHNVRFNGGSQADAEKAVNEIAKKYNIYSPHVQGYLARTRTYRDKDFTDPDAKAEWVSAHTNQESDSWLTPEYSRKIDRILNGYDPNRDTQYERPVQPYSALPEDFAKYFDSNDPIPTWHDGLNSLAADTVKNTNIPVTQNTVELKPAKGAIQPDLRYIPLLIDYSSTGYPNQLSVSNKPEEGLTTESQYVSQALPKQTSSSMPIQAKPVSQKQIQQNAAESMVRAAYKYNAPEMPKRQQETKSQDANGSIVLEQPSKYEVPEVTEQVQQPAKQLTEEEIVNGVLRGDYDNGVERIKKLRALGLSDAEIKHIQGIVNAHIYAGRAMVQRKKTAPRAPKRVSRQQMYNGFPVNYRPY